MSEDDHNTTLREFLADRVSIPREKRLEMLADIATIRTRSLKGVLAVVMDQVNRSTMPLMSRARLKRAIAFAQEAMLRRDDIIFAGAIEDLMTAMHDAAERSREMSVPIYVICDETWTIVYAQGPLDFSFSLWKAEYEKAIKDRVADAPSLAKWLDRPVFSH